MTWLIIGTGKPPRWRTTPASIHWIGPPRHEQPDLRSYGIREPFMSVIRAMCCSCPFRLRDVEFSIRNKVEANLQAVLNQYAPRSYGGILKWRPMTKIFADNITLKSKAIDVIGRRHPLMNGFRSEETYPIWIGWEARSLLLPTPYISHHTIQQSAVAFIDVISDVLLYSLSRLCQTTNETTLSKRIG
jgi:hypothetical protein